ncbi:hypothetical protein ABTX61_04435 [Amycolatopsis japonica]|uniref:hypothetical protein n=1 Tax=Amycolatopsis japonica TaxID=208439 RepID=UPI00331833BD
MDQKEFRRACYEAARRTAGAVKEFQHSYYAPNFDQCHIAYPHRTVAVLWTRDWGRNATWHGLGIAATPVEFGSLTFVDEPGLLAVLKELLPACRVFARAELEGPLDQAEWPWVDEDDVRYWRPDNLGEALFNYWD